MPRFHFIARSRRIQQTERDTKSRPDRASRRMPTLGAADWTRVVGMKIYPSLCEYLRFVTNVNNMHSRPRFGDTKYNCALLICYNLLFDVSQLTGLHCVVRNFVFSSDPPDGKELKMHRFSAPPLSLCFSFCRALPLLRENRLRLISRRRQIGGGVNNTICNVNERFMGCQLIVCVDAHTSAFIKYPVYSAPINFTGRLRRLSGDRGHRKERNMKTAAV